jgi:hypothetical protein
MSRTKSTSRGFPLRRSTTAACWARYRYSATLPVSARDSAPLPDTLTTGWSRSGGSGGRGSVGGLPHDRHHRTITALL